MTITKGQMLAIMPNASRVVDTYLTYINKYAQEFGLDKPRRMAMWLANVAHESNEMRSVSENLNYTAERLMAVFPSRFKTKPIANLYARNPQKLGNYIYANRMGNRGVESGDGYRFRGRGFYQLTGRDNYKAYNLYLASTGVKVDLLTDAGADLIAQPVGAVKSAMWFAMKHLNKYADANNYNGYCKALNGGLVGIASRNAYYARACKVFNVK